MNLLQFYESLLLTAGFSVGQDGAISLALEQPAIPMTIQERRLVLPTPDQLRLGDWTKRIGFHPLAENLLKGESEVFSRYRACLNRKLNKVTASLILELVYIAASPAVQKNLTANQTEYLAKVPEADERTLDNIGKLLNKLPIDDPAKNIISITLKRNGNLEVVKNDKVEKERYPRVAVVAFPLYDALVSSKDHTVFGTKLRAKDIEVLKSLLEYIFPNLQKPNIHYSKGSNSKVAPYTVALMLATKALIECTNNITTLFFNNVADKYQAYVVRDDWYNLIEDLSPLLAEVRLIPNLEATAVATPATVTTPVSTPVSKPTVTNYPTLNSSNVVQPVQQVVSPPAQPVVPVQPVQPVVTQPAQPALPPAPQGYQWVVQNNQWVLAPTTTYTQVQTTTTTTSSNIDDIIRQRLGQVAQQPVYQPVQQPAMVNGWPTSALGVQPTQQVMYDQYGRPIQPNTGYPLGQFGYPIKG